jgi:ubiquinone/menaquinone biosynthesis C-methylase UbiE
MDLRPADIGALSARVVERDDCVFDTEAEVVGEMGLFERAMYELQDQIIVRAHEHMLGGRVDGARLLDDGCGRGRLLRVLGPRAAACCALDLSPTSLGAARDAYLSVGGDLHRLILVEGSGIALPFEDASFDAVVSSEVLEHVPDPLRYLAEIARVLRRGGVATISTPNGWMQWLPYPRNLARVLLRRSSARRALYPERHWHDALIHHPAVRPRVLEAWCLSAGLRIVRHRFTLWNYWSEARLLYRLLAMVERIGFPSAKAGTWLLRRAESALWRWHSLRIFASRQIVLVERDA